MKKLVIFLLIIVLAFAGYLTWLSYQPEQHMAVTDEEIPAYPGEMTEEAAHECVNCLDYEAIRALHSDDELVLTVCGKDITWAEYYAWFSMNAMQVESYFEQMALYYGVAADWSGSTGDDSGMTYAQLPALSTEETLLRFAAIEKLAADKGVELSEASKAQLTDEALAAGVMGEGASLEDLIAALDEMGMGLETFRSITGANFLYSDMLAAEYGADCELVDNDTVALWLGEQGYMCANHILLMTADPATGEVADEATAAEKKALAEELYAELAAIEDVEEKLARFKELKEQYCEDTGKTAYPDGYTFSSGQMVTPFEEAVKASSAYAVHEPVESQYGWHIVMRLPLGKDCLINDAASGAQLPASWVYAESDMNAQVEEVMAANAITYAENFEQINVLDFVISE